LPGCQTIICPIIFKTTTLKISIFKRVEKERGKDFQSGHCRRERSQFFSSSSGKGKKGVANFVSLLPLV
jgi:hypothetical protein